MRTHEKTKLAALVGAAFLVAAEALAAQDQQNPSTENADESKRRIIISVADRKLAVIEDGRVLKIYAAAVGAPVSPSPAGVFTITTRVKNPTWYGPRGVIVAPGKSNPLGNRWMGLSRKGYGIHGTNNQTSIGKSVSHGCIRMRKADVEELFEIVKVGDVVEMVTEPGEELAWIFGAGETLAAATQ